MCVCARSREVFSKDQIVIKTSMADPIGNIGGKKIVCGKRKKIELNVIEKKAGIPSHYKNVFVQKINIIKNDRYVGRLYYTKLATIRKRGKRKWNAQWRGRKRGHRLLKT